MASFDEHIWKDAKKSAELLKPLRAKLKTELGDITMLVDIIKGKREGWKSLIHLVKKKSRRNQEEEEEKREQFDPIEEFLNLIDWESLQRKSRAGATSPMNGLILNFADPLIQIERSLFQNGEEDFAFIEEMGKLKYLLYMLKYILEGDTIKGLSYLKQGGRHFELGRIEVAEAIILLLNRQPLVMNKEEKRASLRKAITVLS